VRQQNPRISRRVANLVAKEAKLVVPEEQDGPVHRREARVAAT
jgi:hypothetical protein